MKIAVIVYGMYREFDIAVKSWNFIDDSDFDFYFSTWSKSIQKCEPLGYDLNEDINTKFENNNVIYVECNYHKLFKKWIPFKKTDSMDNISSVNQIQIILDSL